MSFNQRKFLSVFILLYKIFLFQHKKGYLKSECYYSPHAIISFLSDNDIRTVRGPETLKPFDIFFFQHILCRVSIEKELTNNQFSKPLQNKPSQVHFVPAHIHLVTRYPDICKLRQTDILRQPNICILRQPDICILRQPDICILRQPDICILRQPDILYVF